MTLDFIILNQIFGKIPKKWNLIHNFKGLKSINQ